MTGRRNTPGQMPARETCPLFVSSAETEIVCKSHMASAKHICLRFECRSLKDQQTELFCKGEYKRCEHYLSHKHFSWEGD